MSSDEIVSAIDIALAGGTTWSSREWMMSDGQLNSVHQVLGKGNERNDLADAGDRNLAISELRSRPPP